MERPGPYLSTNGDPMLVTFADDVWSVGVPAVARTLGLSVDTVIRLVKTKIPDIDWPGATAKRAFQTFPMCPFALVAEAINIARAESPVDGPLWLCAMRADGARDGSAALTIEMRKIHATDPDAVFLTIGRVWVVRRGDAFNRERIVEGPFRTYAEALASDVAVGRYPLKIRLRRDECRLYVALRHTPETFYTWCGA